MYTSSSSWLWPNCFLQFKLKKIRPYYKHSLVITYRQVCRPYVYLGLNKTYGMQSIQKCCYPLVFKNANNKCSDWRMITDISYSCLNLPTMQCTSCYFYKVWALLKITTVFKHLFGLDMYLGLYYNCHWIQHHHCQVKIDGDGKQVPRYVHVTGRWRSCTDPWQAWPAAWVWQLKPE